MYLYLHNRLLSRFSFFNILFDSFFLFYYFIVFFRIAVIITSASTQILFPWLMAESINFLNDYQSIGLSLISLGYQIVLVRLTIAHLVQNHWYCLSVNSLTYRLLDRIEGKQIIVDTKWYMTSLNLGHVEVDISLTKKGK